MATVATPFLRCSGWTDGHTAPAVWRAQTDSRTPEGLLPPPPLPLRLLLPPPPPQSLAPRGEEEEVEEFAGVVTKVY